MKKLLVNACCGPCACLPWAFKDYAVSLFFNGDNFDSKEEYERRLKAMRVVAKELYRTSLLVTPLYRPRVFESCDDCIRYRLERTANLAKRDRYDYFTTTLTISPHKDTEMVNRIGREVSAQVGIPFLELDLKKNDGFNTTVRMSREYAVYRQRYCGCKKSMRE
jgi:hypothetical protein